MLSMGVTKFENQLRLPPFHYKLLEGGKLAVLFFPYWTKIRFYGNELKRFLRRKNV